MTEAFIASAVRTPIGRFMGGLSTFTAPQLGAKAVKEAVRRAGLDAAQIEEAVMGCALQAGLGQNPARQAALHAGLSPRVGAFTVNKVCGSGLKAVILAAQSIRAGDADAVVAGGMECMSNAPHLIPEARRGSRLGHSKLIDSMIFDGLWDITNDFHMGISCELAAEKHRVTREAMDEFAMSSHRKAAQAAREGKFKDEIVAVDVPDAKKGMIPFTVDESPRADSSLEQLATLKPVFKKDGLVTAGNASSINDGASALVVVSEKKLREAKLAPLARITGYAFGGMEPKWVMMAPVDAVQNWELKTQLKRDAMDLIEINEAFAGSTVALIRELKLDANKVNVHGGAVALGHPIGASGARILTTLIYALRQRKLKTGLATLCMGGGNALALSIELT